MSKSDKPKLTSLFLNGIITENPTFRLVLGTCPTIATATSVINAVGKGAAASFVLIGSNFVISLLRNFIPDKVRIPCFIVVICTFVTIVQLLLQAFVQSLYASLGMFIDVNERLPLPTDDFSPCRFSNTRVRQPMVATS